MSSRWPALAGDEAAKAKALIEAIDRWREIGLFDPPPPQRSELVEFAAEFSVFLAVVSVPWGVVLMLGV